MRLPRCPPTIAGSLRSRSPADATDPPGQAFGRSVLEGGLLQRDGVEHDHAAAGRANRAAAPQFAERLGCPLAAGVDVLRKIALGELDDAAGVGGEATGELEESLRDAGLDRPSAEHAAHGHLVESAALHTQQRERNRGVALQILGEPRRGHHDRERRFDGDNIGRAAFVVERAHLADELAGGAQAEHRLGAGCRDHHDLDESVDQVEDLARLRADADDPFARGEMALDADVAKRVELVGKPILRMQDREYASTNAEVSRRSASWRAHARPSQGATAIQIAQSRAQCCCAAGSSAGPACS